MFPYPSLYFCKKKKKQLRIKCLNTFIFTGRCLCSSQTHSSVRVNCCWILSSTGGLLANIYHLDLQQLLLVGGVHLLQGLLQLMVPVQEGFSQLCRQMEICASGGKYVNKRYEAACMPKHRHRIQIHASKATVTSHGRPHGKYLA